VLKQSRTTIIHNALNVYKSVLLSYTADTSCLNIKKLHILSSFYIYGLHIALRCTTSRNVAGSIPDGVIGIFYWYNISGRTVALGSTQPLTEMSTGNVSWG